MAALNKLNNNLVCLLLTKDPLLLEVGVHLDHLRIWNLNKESNTLEVSDQESNNIGLLHWYWQILCRLWISKDASFVCQLGTIFTSISEITLFYIAINILLHFQLFVAKKYTFFYLKFTAGTKAWPIEARRLHLMTPSKTTSCNGNIQKVVSVQYQVSASKSRDICTLALWMKMRIFFFFFFFFFTIQYNMLYSKLLF